ncbi:MAG: hypothetical protein JSW17_00500 [Candidatus Omnitrophota bacterium]|nr:MAG: hypothetical protein JSW17_00500 [Candidatus Omnitrophota bacterium]
MGLKEELQKIVKLQEIDSQLYKLTHQKDVEKPSRLNETFTGLEEQKRTLATSKEKIQQLQLKKKDRELELQTKEEAVKKAQGELYQLKTNKEYQAKLNEIASHKADVSLLEEEVLKALEEIEGAEKELNQIQGARAEQEKKFKEEESTVATEIKEIDIQMKGLEDKRNIIAKDVNPKIFAKYEQLIKSRHGEAIAPIVNDNCGFCHMRVTPQTINEIKMYKDLVLCHSCVRILYIPEDLEG